MKKRSFILIYDGAGIGEQEDSYKFGDTGSNTLKHTIEYSKGLNIPVIESLGLGKIIKIKGVKSDLRTLGAFGKMREKSNGKDSVTGHWEIAGIILKKGFDTYPNGFPDEIINKFKNGTNVQGILGNRASSGTVIIEQLGLKHMKTGFPIIYTSDDSVFQIACHKNVITLERLYEYCLTARKILDDGYNVARVIARPFIGTPGNFSRTYERNDYSVVPPEKTLLDILKENNFDVIGIGKIDNLFSGNGLTEDCHTTGDEDGLKRTIEVIERDNWEGLAFINLVDFDTKYGHRNNIEGYRKNLELADRYLKMILKRLRKNDILFITADHGNDPTTPSTDHSREFVPLLTYCPEGRRNVNLGIRNTFADIGATIAEYHGLTLKAGESFLKDLF
ncbi:phosphopentomutase [candidate division TA06 bacterium]|uniref:Phosphopentomutase n=1 Tax=candidate division TA06 bacterium TaxID=2250710 RepID=A0A660SRD5_UNCT6|nr:MAG: phosphopentomutase [candidate division TA06 bacterium]